MVLDVSVSVLILIKEIKFATEMFTERFRQVLVWISKSPVDKGSKI